jgi:16S rRNA (cytidine1402-2'-O)-methyltransferase
MPPGTLFIVATPIGNLEDITLRALRTLREVDLIAAEDTRRTSKLLARYDIRKPLVSLHEHNEHRERVRLVGRLQAGEQVALVSDAGTPGISDPGAPLVRAAREAGIRVVPVPGPSAVAAALSVSGIDLAEFAFMGFPPRSGAERDEWMKRLRDDPRTVVFYEAPHRIHRTLTDVTSSLVERPIFVYKEITKIYEELVVYTKTVSGWNLPDFSEESVGEYTLIVGPVEEGTTKIDSPVIESVFYRLTDSSGFTGDEAETMTASLLGTTKAVVRKVIKKARISNKQRAASSA